MTSNWETLRLEQTFKSVPRITSEAPHLNFCELKVRMERLAILSLPGRDRGRGWPGSSRRCLRRWQEKEQTAEFKSLLPGINQHSALGLRTGLAWGRSAKRSWGMTKESTSEPGWLTRLSTTSALVSHPERTRFNYLAQLVQPNSRKLPFQGHVHQKEDSDI